MKLAAYLAALALLSPGDVSIAQDAQAGADLWRGCRACHAVGPDARNLVGPILNGLSGRRAGTVAGFISYSDAMKNAGIVWSEATFKRYAANPQAAIPGSKEGFSGLRTEKDAADLWAYLKQF